MTALPSIQRRALLGLAAAAAMLPRHAPAAQMALAEPVAADAPTITVAGPGDSDVAHWARALQAPLAAGLLAPDSVNLRFVGGRDGVTGVNQFDARAMPDGANALLVPGSIFVAWLAGDRRVLFDATHLLPLLAGSGPGIVMMRGGLAAKRRAPVRLACRAGLDPACAALLALDLLGVPALPVDTGADARQTVLGGGADAMVAGGTDVPALVQAGLVPVFGFGLPGCCEGAGTVPPLLDLLPAARVRADPLVAAWAGLAAASATTIVLALPRLCPSHTIARWQAAVAACAADPDVTAESSAHGVRLLQGRGAGRAVEAMLVRADAQAALRGWFSMRLDWQPS